MSAGLTVATFAVGVLASAFDPLILTMNAFIGWKVARFQTMAVAGAACFIALEAMTIIIAAHEQAVVHPRSILYQLVASSIILLTARSLRRAVNNN
ncbi:hypothetical protein [Azospirillum sp. sgz302134]